MTAPTEYASFLDRLTDHTPRILSSDDLHRLTVAVGTAR